MPEAGWYPDPSRPATQRYWDGTAWTDHIAPAPAVAQGPAYGVGGLVHPAGQYVVAPKNPAVSLLVSLFIPGVGSMINGDVGIGVVILGGYIVSWVLVIVLIGILGVFGFWVWGLIDAYTGARRWNARHGIIS